VPHTDHPDKYRPTKPQLSCDGRLSGTHKVVGDGAPALAWLRRHDGHADAPRSDLILVDLDLRGVDGQQVLAEVTADPALRTIPVVVFTTATLAEDIAAVGGALGATVPVETPCGLVQVPAGFSTGRRLRLRGWGLPDPRGRPGVLSAEVKVTMPKSSTFNPQHDQAPTGTGGIR
jgi:CheY-like chemotaxis protein